MLTAVTNNQRETAWGLKIYRAYFSHKLQNGWSWLSDVLSPSDDGSVI